MTLDDLGLPEEDRQEIRAALLTWKKDGVARPLIPLDHDVNGDGVADAFGLDENDELIIVTDANLKDTVSRADGSGIEGGEGE